MKNVMLLASMGLSVAVSLALSILLGSYIDRTLNTMPLFTIGLVVFIFVLWILRAIRLVKEIGNEIDQSDQT